MTNELYIQVGLTTLRSPDDVYFIDVPLYIKVNEVQSSGLARIEESLLKVLNSLVIKKNATKLTEKIENLKKEKMQNGKTIQS